MDNKLPSEESKSKSKSQPALWALAGFLVLVLAVYHFRSGEEGQAEEPVKNNASPPQQRQPVSKPEPAVVNANRQAVNWPAISFEEVVDHNPFQPEKSLRRILLGTEDDQAAAEAVEQALEEARVENLRQQVLARELASPDRQVRLLIQSQRGAAAMIGDQMVHVGDEIDEYRVVKIDLDGVVLRRSDTPDSASVESE